MDALLPTFVAALLAEMGDKTQMLAALLAVKFRRAAAVLAGIAVAAIANSVLAAIGGKLVADIITFQALTLLMALALISAGAGALWRQKPPTLSSYGPIGAFATSGLAFFILEFGDKTQFLTFAIAAHSHSMWLASAGAAAGVVVAAAPAIALAENFAEASPPRAIRVGVGVLFLIVGAVVAVGALRLL